MPPLALRHPFTQLKDLPTDIQPKHRRISDLLVSRPCLVGPGAGAGAGGWSDNGYILQPKNILSLHNPINRIDRLNAPNIPSISICNCLRHRCSGMEEKQPECHRRTPGTEHTTSITLITTQSRGGGVYGALPTTTGRCFALSAQAATLCGDLLWTAWARVRSIWRLSPLFEVSIACFPRCGEIKGRK